MKKTLLTALAALAASVTLAEPIPMPDFKDWRGRGKWVKVEGDRLIVDVPKGAKVGSAVLWTELDLSAYNRCHLAFEIRCRASGLVKPARSGRSVKFMLVYRDPLTGEKVYASAKDRPEEGDFDWRTVHTGAICGELPVGRDDPPRLCIGLQETSGRVEFDLSSLKAEREDEFFPMEDNDYRVSYPAAVEARGRMRGVMGRGRCRNTPKDLDDLRKYGANLVRLQLNGCGDKAHPERLTLAQWDAWFETNLVHVAQMLDWAEARDMRIVLDLHHPPLGGYGRNGNVFFVREYADRFLSAWREMARRFGGRRGLYGYDLMNEPAQYGRALPGCDYWNLQRRAAEEIRKIDPTTPIVFAANEWSKPGAFRYLKALEMDNVIYQVHMYVPGAYTHQGANGSAAPGAGKALAYPNAGAGWDKEFLRRTLQPVRDFQLRHGAKIFVGEFSASIHAPGAGQYLSDCIDLFEEYGWDWTYHSFREAKFWDVETVLDEKGRSVPNCDNDRFRALVGGFNRPPRAK